MQVSAIGDWLKYVHRVWIMLFFALLWRQRNNFNLKKTQNLNQTPSTPLWLLNQNCTCYFDFLMKHLVVLRLYVLLFIVRQTFHEVVHFILALHLGPLSVPEERKIIVSPSFSPQESKFYVLWLKYWYLVEY